MNKVSKLIFASAALLAAFVSCQKVEEISEAPKTTHIVRFTTEMPTKTSYVVDGNSVKYSWEEADIENLKVFEDGIQGEITNYAITDGVLSLEVSFTDSQESYHIYTAYLNGAVKSEQVETGTGSYDPTCDVLVAKPVQSSELGEGGAYTFSFRRPVAITELKLKGLTAGEKVSKVTVISDSEHPIAGRYTQSSTDDSTGDWSESSNKIVVSFGESKTVDGEGVLNLSIVTRPIKEASVKVLVETENGLKYRKVTASALTLLADVVKAQGIGLNPVTEAEHAEDGWYLVTDASELFDGDEIRIACTSENMMAGDFAVDKDSKTQPYLANCAVSFDKGKLTGVTPGSEPQIFTLAEGYDKWNIKTANGTLGATDAKKMAYNSGTSDWGISIGNEGVATISSETDGYGDIKYNNTYPRFLNYASGQTDIQIFKKYGTPEDPIIKTARTASFSSETATVTIDANDNVFPELSFEPEEATGGEQSWTSSNTEVATVNAETGEVTLVSDGTTTISVEITATDTYQPCSAEYALTVNPAAIAGEDCLNWAFTNVTSYTDWTNTGSASGNTYAGQSSKFKSDDNNNSDKIDAIQMRTNNSNSGIVVTTSPNDKVARKITVGWNTHTTNGRTLDIYGKSTAYSSAADLYSSEAATQGTLLGSIVKGTSTELAISGDYEFIGIRSNDGALYLNWIKIQWEDAKPEYNLSFWNAMAEETVSDLYVNVAEGIISYIKLRDGENIVSASKYESSDPDVATVDNSGAVTLKKKGEAVITATLNGDETHRKTEVSYTIHVANVLSSIALAEDSAQPTSFYIGQDFSFSGIKVEATYNDGEKKTLTDEDLTADNFSGFDSSEATEKQTITVSYIDGETETATYDIEIKPLVTLYGITVPAEDANGNSITVKGGLPEAAEGDEIELNVNLAIGYKLTSLKVNEVEHSADVAEGKYTFNMPAEDVIVTAEFDNHYTVTIEQPSANGTVKVQNATTSPQSIACGETVSVLAEPATGYELDSWTINGAELADATKASTTFTMPANDVSVTASFKVQVASVHDVLTNLDLAATNNSYTAFTNVKKNTAVYAGQSSKNNGIQLRATNPSGIVSTTSGGKIKTVTVKWNVDCTAGRVLDVYGKNSAYSTAADLYNNTNQGTKIGSIVQGQSTSLTITGDYSYVGVRSNNGALNIDNIDFEWVDEGDTPPTPTTYYTLTLTQVTGGTISAEVGGQSVSNGTKIEEDKTVTIMAEASSGYSFTSWSLPSSGLESSTSATTTFTMSADTEVKANFTLTGANTVTWVAQTASDNPGDSQDWLTGQIDANISWSATKGGNNNPKYYANGTGLRIYNGGSFTVSAKNDKKITKIVLTFSGTESTFSTNNTTTPQPYDLNSVTSKTWEVSRTCRLQKVEVTYN